MDKIEAAKRRLGHVLCQQADTHDRAAEALGILARPTEEQGRAHVVEALLQLAYLHRATLIQLDARASAFGDDPDQGL